MVTKTCTLIFKDGTALRGEASAESPEAESRYEYSGEVERLPRRYERGSLSDLEMFFRALARELDATLKVETSGEYTRWAE